eukprot:scaffold3018_cov62-Isochrysis_galbana.AAC.1
MALQCLRELGTFRTVQCGRADLAAEARPVRRVFKGEVGGQGSHARVGLETQPVSLRPFGGEGQGCLKGSSPRAVAGEGQSLGRGRSVRKEPITRAA